MASAGAAAAQSKYSQKVGRTCVQRQRLNCATSFADGAGDCGRQDLEKELEDSIECLRQMGIMLEQHSGAQNEGCYFDKINEVVEHYGRLYAMRGAVRDKVPVRVIEDYLDKGLNPELYTKHRLQEAEQLYQVARSLARALCPCPACACACATCRWAWTCAISQAGSCVASGSYAGRGSDAALAAAPAQQGARRLAQAAARPRAARG